MPVSSFMGLMYNEGDMGIASPQQWLLYERRNQAAELRKQITGLMFELCQTFSGSDCDKILDLLVCHTMPWRITAICRQYGTHDTSHSCCGNSA